MPGVNQKVVFNGKFVGRQVIYTDVENITKDNLLVILHKAMTIHENNRYQIDYLYNYYKGDQPILNRVKDIREEINNKVVENRANEIVSFKTGYLMGQPVQYVTRKNDKQVNVDLDIFNDFFFMEGKTTKDKKLVDWMHICGTAYRMILPRKDDRQSSPEAPFNIYKLDPRYCFVVYFNGLGEEPKMGVKYVTQDDGTIITSVYTKDTYFEIKNDKIVKQESHTIGYIPIVEYPLNEARLGSFEIVLTMLDAINLLDSNRMDGIEQFVQALMVFKGVDIDSDDFKALKEKGGIKIPAEADVKYLIQELNQQQTQTLKNDMYETILTICGMPNRNGGSSTSDTGTAVIMRDGWSAAEARAQDTEEMFKESEKQFLRIAINIANTLRRLSLRLSDIDIRFTRRNYENIQGKAQVLTTMLANPKIDPKLAFEHCGMFTDPNLAYEDSRKYYESELDRQQKDLRQAIDGNKGKGEE